MGDQIIMFISQIFNGLKIGSVYSLVALGYTMVYGIIRLINFAHGDFIMVGAYVLMLTIPAIVAFGLPAWVAVIPAILMCVAVPSSAPITRPCQRSSRFRRCRSAS